MALTRPVVPKTILCAVALLAASCAQYTSAQSALISVLAQPHTAKVAVGKKVSFSAVVNGAAPDQSAAVVWSVQEPAGGTVDVAGVYTAPASAGTFHVVATSFAKPSSSDVATVVVENISSISVAVTPGTATVLTGGTLQFAATVSGAASGDSTAVTWSVQEAGGGTVTSAGAYTAPTTAGTYHVVATSVADPTQSDVAAVQVTATPVIAVAVSPKTAATTTGRTLNFSATVTGTVTGQSTAVTWSVQESGGGTVDTTGHYTAPASAGTFHVVATSAADTTKKDTATVTVTTIAVAVAPKTAATTTGGALTFSATVTGTVTGQSTAVTWSVQEANGGTVDTAGHYTAPATAGTYHVVAISAADTTKKDTATVTVTAIAVAVSPKTAATTAGGGLTFSATVTGTATGQSTAVTWSVQEAGGGTVDTAGHYTAPGAAGTYHVVATSVADASKNDSATITVTPPGISVTISPKVAFVATAGSVTFAATVNGATTGQSTAVTWSVQEAGGGSVDSSGQYTAPAAAGTYHVVATSVADPSRSDTATVTANATTLIAADRVTVWNPGLNSVGGIPNRTTICKTLSPKGGTLDDTAAIQSALDTCPANQVVQLTAGNYRISDPGLNFRTSNITLRGSGPGVTVLTQRPTAQYGVIAMGTQWYQWMSPKAFTTDAVKETNSVTLANTTGLTVGQLVHVNETYDSSLIYFNPSQQNGDYQGWGEGRQGPQASSRPVGQAMEIASISGNTVTFTTGFHQSYRVNHSAHLTQISDGAKVVATTKWSGIEDLTVENGSGGDGGGNIRMFASSHCWAKHIESRNQNAGAAFAFDGAFQCEVRDSYLHSAQDPNPGGAGYSIVFDSYTADSLAENNISWNFNKVSAFRSSGGGNVFGYNYCEDMYGQGYPTIVEVGINASHMAGSHHELFEGNQGPNFDSDSYWGSQMYITAFRNHLTMMRRSVSGVAALGNGVLANLVDSNNKRGIGLTVYQKWYSFVGNVIGVPNGYLQSPAIGFAYPSTFGPGPQGSVFRYEWLGGPFGTDTSPTYAPIWQIGYDGSNWFTTQESTSQATVQRDGNYDYFTKQVHWHGVGGTGQNNGLTAPAGATLPSSLYLSSKPAFFGSNPWPWVDGSSATAPLPGVLPARMRFDAGTPNSP